MDSNQFNFTGQPSLPPMAPQAPPIFGNYTAEPQYADDNSQGADEGNEQGDSKRRRIARACDMCRKKKIKCDGKMPACTNCQNYKTECIFTHVEKKRNPPKGAKYIEGLENRLGRMESLLRLSGLLSEDDDGQTDLGTLEKRLQDHSTANRTRNEGRQSTRNSEPDTASHTEPAASQQPSPSQPQPSPAARPSVSSPISPDTSNTASQNPEDVGNLSDMMCSLLTNNNGETRYIGSSSGFSIFSPRGIQWVSEKTGDSSFPDMVFAQTEESMKWMHWPETLQELLFTRRVFQPLPPKQEAQSLCRDYFENFNCIFPLFHELTFMHLLDEQYAGRPTGGSGWWASLNVVFALAQRLRVMSRVASKEEDAKSWGYVKNAMGVMTELTLQNTDLLSVQAIMGLALFLQGTPNPQPMFFLVAAAIRMAHSIGLHKRGSGFGLNADESEQRKRVFWIAYMIDKDVCLRSGRPPAQDDDDMNVELPSADPPDGIGDIPLSDGKGKVNMFRHMVTFAIIQSNVYKRLYSVKAFKQSDGDLLNTIGELDKELQDWKDEIPIDFRPEHEIKFPDTPLLLHIVVLHFAYYNCLTTIHRMSVHHGYWTSRLSNFAIKGLNMRPLNPRVFSSAALCVTAARASIHLIKYIPHTDYACVWLILYYPVSALVTLFANILQNPQDGRARSDLKLMNAVVSFLSIVTEDESNTSANRMLNVCTEFERIARVVLDRKDREKNRRGKRKPDEDTPRNDNASPSSSRDHNRGSEAPGPGTVRAASTPGSGMGAPLRKATPRASVTLTPGPSGSPAPGFAGDVGGSQPFPATPGNSGGNPDPRSPPGVSTPAWLNEMVQPSMGHGPFSPGPLGPSELQATDDSHIQGPADGGLDFGGAFQEPFVPHDLWQMPMALEWDWADMTHQLGGFGASGAPGDIGDTGMEDAGGVDEAAGNDVQTTNGS